MSGGIKRTPLDALVSTLVRERAAWTCERCGTYYPPGPGREGLHGSHYKGRRARWTRHDTDNVRSHCYGCHQYLAEHPALFANWMADTVGAARMDRIRWLTNRTDKQPRDWQKACRAHYRAELARIMDLREQGRGGYLEVQPYE